MGQRIGHLSCWPGLPGCFARGISTRLYLAHNFERPIFWPPRQLLTRQTRNMAAFLVIAAAMASGVACRSEPLGRAGGPHDSPSRARGGDLIVSLRSDPQSFNWYTRRDSSTYLVTLLTQAWLARVNRLTDTVEPWLAESWSASPDGLRYTIKLRQGVTFADGAPFTAEDVVFSLAAAYDEKGGSIIADSMRVGGKNLTAEAVDPTTVVITFPGPFGPGLRLLDNLPILPKHKVQTLAAESGLAATWRTSSNLADITGLGPFTLAEYAAGRRLVFARNPRYFRKDADGTQLPLVDRVVIEIVADQSAETAAARVGPDRPLGERDPARGLRAVQAGRRRGAAEAPTTSAWRSTPTRCGST